MKREWRRLLTPALILLLGLVAVLPDRLHEIIERATIEVQHKLRGPRPLPDDYVLIFIGPEDDRVLGGWPITRDYYGYLLHVLNTAGAKAIAFDILFDKPSPRYPEYDEVVAGFIESSRNVCLPFAFSGGIQYPRETSGGAAMRIATGSSPVYPVERFRQHAAGVGFSNLGPEAAAVALPVVATFQDTLYYSFGMELARVALRAEAELDLGANVIEFSADSDMKLRIPLDHKGRLHLNHFGDSKDVTAISLVDFMKSFEASPDSIDLDGKIVLIAATAPGRTTIASTPLATALPASLLHLTVAENLIEQNYLRVAPDYVTVLLILLLSAIGWAFASFMSVRNATVLVSIVLLFYFISSALLFEHLNFVLPIFYSPLALVVAFILQNLERSRRERKAQSALRNLLESQIAAKERDLDEATSELEELSRKYDQTVREKTSQSEQDRLLAEEQRRRVFELEKQLADLRAYEQQPPETKELQFSEIVHSPESQIAEVIKLISKISSDDIPVLILGETGTGKEIIARAIHESSQRRKGPFVAVNCGALPETLLESELFGHEKGSFTGADSRRRGRFEMADGGTLFLDEITETSPAFQARLLRVLQEQIFERVGGEKPVQVNVRIVAASSRDLPTEVAQERFRADLFYRLNGFPIQLPALRERTADIPLLAVHFLKKHGYDQTVTDLSDGAMKRLLNYRWPGNVRELENAIRRAAILAQSEGRSMIRGTDLPEEINAGESWQPEAEINYQPLEEQIIESLRAFKFSRASISKTAKALGNRDRGTIAEYLRGICFETLVHKNFDIKEAAREIAGTDEPRVLERVENKIHSYLSNVAASLESFENDQSSGNQLPSTFKGLPKKYQTFLNQIIEHFNQIEKTG